MGPRGHIFGSQLRPKSVKSQFVVYFAKGFHWIHMKLVFKNTVTTFRICVEHMSSKVWNEISDTQTSMAALLKCGNW